MISSEGMPVRAAELPDAGIEVTSHKKEGGFGRDMTAAMALFFVAMAQVWVWAGAQTPPANKKPAGEEAEKLVEDSDCSSCHAIDRQLVGPAYNAVAKRYAGQTGIVEKLAARIRQGGSGEWGEVAMPPHPNLTDTQLREMVKWILSLKDRVAAKPGAGTKKYTYNLKNGETVRLDFRLFVEGKDDKVTKGVFRGYQLYNSYCFRCHGQDAVSGQLAPDLRRSLRAGMTPQQFLAVAMAGKKAEGMPSWAGFFNAKEIERIYQYVRGRSVGLVPAGRPPSEFD